MYGLVNVCCSRCEYAGVIRDSPGCLPVSLLNIFRVLLLKYGSNCGFVLVVVVAIKTVVLCNYYHMFKATHKC